jgi:hypothetical protein
MAKKTIEETQITKTETTAIEVHDYGEYAGKDGQLAAGYDNQTTADIAIPMLEVLQPLTPCVVQNQEPSGGPRAGMIRNKLDGMLWSNPEGLLGVPALTMRKFTEFVPRDAGGGFCGNHEPESDVVLDAMKRAKEQKLEFGELYTSDGNELTETFYVYMAICDENDATGMAIFPFSSAKIKHYRNWISVVRAHTDIVNGVKQQPPLFAHLTRFTTFLDRNKKGDSFWNIVIKPANGKIANSLLAKTDSRLIAGLNMREMVNAGIAKVDFNQARDSASPSGGGKTTPF